MKILAGDPNGIHKKSALALDCGCMIPCCVSSIPGPRYHDFTANGLAMDNGAFGCHSRGELFDLPVGNSPQGEMFKRCVAAANKHRLELDFVVCPDKVMGGIDSLEFSEKWRPHVDYPRIALVVQDGMHGEHLEGIIQHYDYLFVGGSVEWKWLHAFYWVMWGHQHGVPVHIGQAGQPGMMATAARYGADSIDSTSWPRNNSWWIVENYRRNAQMELGLPDCPPLAPPLVERKADTRWISKKRKPIV